MSKKYVWLIAAALVALVLTGCGTEQTPIPRVTNTPFTANNITPSAPLSPENFVPVTPVASPQAGTAVGRPFLPGEVLVGLPVYPGAAGTTFLNPGFGPPSFPAESPIYSGKSPGYQSASAQYTVAATPEDILGWYLTQLTGLGYRHSGESGGGNQNITSRAIPFFLPSQPLVSVEVHTYSGQSASGASVFELLVTYSVPLPRPSGEVLPEDVASVKIDYTPVGGNEAKKTITDAQAIAGLVNMINNLPVRPDYLTLGGPIGSAGQTLFTLVFHSAAGGDIEVTDVLGQGIQIGSYPALDDPHNLLQEAVARLAGAADASG